MQGWRREEVYSYGRLAARQSWTVAGGIDSNLEQTR